MPNVHFPNVSLPAVQYGYFQNDNDWIRPTTYDEILLLLEEIESEDIETKVALHHDIADLTYKGDGSFKGFVELQYEKEILN